MFGMLLIITPITVHAYLEVRHSQSAKLYKKQLECFVAGPDMLGRKSIVMLNRYVV